MVGRLLRVTGTTLVIAVALVTPVLATTTATPAVADSVVDGCTIVSNPTSTNFTNCPGADMAGADLHSFDLSFADFAGADFAGAVLAACPSGVDSFCNHTTLTDANLSQVNLTGAVFAAATTAELRPGAQAATFDGANLTGAILTGAVLAASVTVDGEVFGALVDFTDATLTNANFTDTIPPLVAFDQSVTATSQAGAVVTWSTNPPDVPGATPGSCAPASGSTFPLFSSTVTCQVLDAHGDVGFGNIQVNVAPTTQFFTRVVSPADGATLAGAPYLDALAADAPGVTNVIFELSGGPSNLSDQVIATATSTYYGWLAKWNTTSVPNGNYTLQSVATDADNNTDTSTPVSITVNNQAPATAVRVPSGGATVSGDAVVFDATASANVSSVNFTLTGGTLSNKIVATATPTLYGWISEWNALSVPNGTYNLESVASYANGVSAPSAPVTITVDNVPLATQLLVPSSGAQISGNVVFDAAAQGTDITGVYFVVSIGPIVDHQTATATPTYYGWIGQWNSLACPPGYPNGSYIFQSVVTQAGGGTAMSAPVDVTLNNTTGGCP